MPLSLRSVGAFAVAALALTAFYVWSYRDCIGAFFYLDEFWVLREAANIHIHTPLDLMQFFRPVFTFLLYRPVSTLVYFYMLHSFFGYDPPSYHATQMAFHILNALLVYAIAERLLRSRALALAVAFVYATAPGHAIAVYWVVLFTMTGTAFFYLLGLWAWLRFSSPWRVPVTLTLFVVALLASEHAVTFPLVLTLATVLLEPQWNWKRALRQQAPFYVIAGAYVAAKLYYLRYILPVRYPFAVAGYGMSFGPRMGLRHIGVYLRFGVDVFYTLITTDTRALAVGFLIVATASIATACVLSGRWQARPLRIAAFGLDVFVVTLTPVLFLSAHVEPYYVGIAGMGVALTVVSLMQLVPWSPKLATWLLVAALLGVHGFSTRGLIQETLQFQLFRGASELAARWLYAMAAIDGSAIDEVVVPREPVTHWAFTMGGAHKLFLCAPFSVRTSRDIRREVPSLRRLVIAEPPAALPAPPGPDRAWPWLRSDCSP